MSVINTNITSMIGQQNLRESQNALSTSMERLSSGLRINSAKDDAAGQAIANRMSAQITGLGQAQRNANDGISVAQTAEGGLNQINDNLQRVRELSVQAQNGTNSTADLQSIQDEIGQRLNEINRISDETDFNGTKVLKEGIESLNIQVGANDGETISVNLQAINTEQLSMEDFSVGGFLQVDNAAATGGDLTAANFTADGDNYVSGNAGSDDLVALLAEDGDTADVTGGASFERVGADDFTSTEALANQAAAEAAVTGAGLTFSAGGVSIDVTFAANGSISAGTIYEDGAGGYTSVDSGGLTGLTTAADLFGSTEDSFTLTGGDTSYTSDASGNFSEITAGQTGGDLETAFNGSTVAIDGTDFDVAAGGATVSSGGNEQYVDADGALSDTQTTYYEQTDADGVVTYNSAEDGSGDTVYVNSNPEATSTLTTEASWTDTENEAAAVGNLETIDEALSMVDSLRSELGAVQNRFESAITNLSTNETNLSAARSRIEDADYATEVADMTRSQILQQAGTSVLAQANQIPQNVLSLLG